MNLPHETNTLVSHLGTPDCGNEHRETLSNCTFHSEHLRRIKVNKAKEPDGT